MSAVATLVSGGLDSAVLMAELSAAGDDVFPVYVRSGLVWEDAEVHWLRRLLSHHGFQRCAPPAIVELPVRDTYGDHWSTTGRGVPGFDTALDSNYLPGRNLLLLSIGSVFCAVRDIRRIAMAPLRDNPFPDARPEFFRTFEHAAELAIAGQVKIETPFLTLEKDEVVRRGRHLPLELTFSCIQPRGIEHCGDCTKCAERQRGFREAGIPDPSHYARTIAGRNNTP